MTLAFGLFFVAAAFELSVHLAHPRHKTFRLILGLLAGLAVVAASIVWIWYEWNIFNVLAAIVNLYRIFNIVRMLRGRMHANYLWHTTQRTSICLLTVQFIILGMWAVFQHVQLPALLAWEIVIALQLAASLVMTWSTASHARRMRAIADLQPVATADLPPLTVAVPARNESEELQACIESILESDYPKLEILVLDDCSQSTRTPEIIRSFAHKGVRFLQGRSPKTNWLAKNQAYNDLARAASGEYIVFVGVDIRLGPDALRNLMAYTLQKDKSMVCVMPQNVQPDIRASFMQPMRYVWELALPRKLVNRPPVLSSCWLIKRSALLGAGGFAAASRMIIPEAYFARKCMTGNGYSFLATGTAWNIASIKDAAAQRRTAIRVAYPQLHRRPEIVMCISLAAAVWSVSLVGLMVEAIVWRRLPVIAMISVVLAWLCFLYMYRMILALAYGKVNLVTLFAFPAAVLGYIGLMHYSMYKYEFSEVLWKGRNICLPVMHVVPRLPGLK
jgi:glycosyltransferase involved in cell wall biosynthesis